VEADVDTVFAQALDRLGQLNPAAVHLDSPLRQRIGDL
jgi:hypothetical protein